MAKSSKNTTICITKGSAVHTPVVPTAVSKAKPPVCDIADTTGLLVGDLVTVKSSGFSELDDRTFVIGAVVANTSFTLLGADTTGSTGSLDGGAVFSHYSKADMQCLCLSSLGFSVDEPGVISTATFCDPTASIPSAVQSAGTLTFGGYVDIADADYAELLLAAEDGKERIVRITLPNNGYMVAPVTFSSISWDIPLDGAVAYTGSAVLGSKMRHLYV